MTFPQTMRRCPADDHDHGAVLRAGSAGRTREETERLWDELARRRCGGGPLVTDIYGQPGRLDPNELLGGALSGLPEVDDGRPLPEVLDDMGLRTVDDLRSFRRLVAAEAALKTICWAAAPAKDAADAAGAVLIEVDDPASRWS